MDRFDIKYIILYSLFQNRNKKNRYTIDEIIDFAGTQYQIVYDKKPPSYITFRRYLLQLNKEGYIEKQGRAYMINKEKYDELKKYVRNHIKFEFINKI